LDAPSLEHSNEMNAGLRGEFNSDLPRRQRAGSIYGNAEQMRRAIVAAVIALAMSPTSIGVRGAASKAQSFLNMISSERCN
jgi:hypothetical protein